MNFKQSYRRFLSTSVDYEVIDLECFIALIIGKEELEICVISYADYFQHTSVLTTEWPMTDMIASAKSATPQNKKFLQSLIIRCAEAFAEHQNLDPQAFGLHVLEAIDN